MAADRRLALQAALCSRYDSLEVLASSVDHQGRLVALLADPDQGFEPIPYFSVLRPPPRYDAFAVISDGELTREIGLGSLDLWYNRIDTLGDGVVLCAARCGPSGVDHRRQGEPVPDEELQLTRNLRVFDGDGRCHAAFYAADAIEQLMTDPHGNIWTGYFDESSYWAPNPDGTRSYTFMMGLARWGLDGRPRWMASSDAPGVGWADCYALNVGRHTVHACPYREFPLVRIGADGRWDATPNPVTRCTGLAVSGDELAFLAQRRNDGEYRWEIRRARREDGAVVETGREPLLLPDGRQPTGWARGKLGRDCALYLYEDGDPRTWYRYDLDV
jgi:hypothetical protein